MNQELISFVKDAKQTGKSLKEIGQILLDSGWEPSQVNDTLERFVENDFPIAIPKPIVFASPRLVVLNIFHFLMLYFSVYNVVATLFTFLDYYLSDGLGHMSGFYYSSYQTIGQALRDNLSTLAVCAPLVGLSQAAITQSMRSMNQKIPRIRLKFIYATMLCGALSLVSSTICMIYYLLAGELGVRFLLKLCILTLAAAWIYVFYRVDIKHSEKNA